MRLGESVVVETVTAIGMQMTHQVVFEAGNNCGDGFDENDEEQAEEWLVHEIPLVVKVGWRCALLLFLYQGRGAMLTYIVSGTVAGTPSRFLQCPNQRDSGENL